jgi:hypothetical protein
MLSFKKSLVQFPPRWQRQQVGECRLCHGYASTPFHARRYTAAANSASVCSPLSKALRLLAVKLLARGDALERAEHQ